MARDEDYSGHKTWRFIYAVLFIVNAFGGVKAYGPFLTAVIGVVLAFLYMGQQKCIDEIKARQRDGSKHNE
jgi:hypothetical protein